MTTTTLPAPHLRAAGDDGYGHARMPRSATAPEPERIDRVAYGRFRNVYLYITEACQLHTAAELISNGQTPTQRP